jgi:hypothetical protein
MTLIGELAPALAPEAATYSVMGGLLWHFLAADGLALQGGGRGAHRDHSGRVRDSSLWVAILRGIQSDRGINQPCMLTKAS